MKRNTLPALLLLATPLLLAAPAPANLLRNGSFEGGLLYWHNLEAGKHELVQGDAAVGDYHLKLDGCYTMSAPFVAKRDAWFTISLFARGEKPGRLTVGMPPSAREPGTKAKRLWTAEGGQSAALGTDWKRYSFSFPADVPPDGFWPNPHYMVHIESAGHQALHVDGVTVTEGKTGTAAYLPRRPLETVAECVNLPGWDGAAGNAFPDGATARMRGHVSNPGPEPRRVTVRWQLVDYEGTLPVAPPRDRLLTIPAGATTTVAASIPLTHKGFVYARLSVLDEGGELIDKSDLPLTSIPYPKMATKPDFRERFGGSFAGGLQMLQKYQRLGFGWTRWYPETKWHSFQPEQGAPFHWFEKEFDLAAAHGVSQHVVLYGWPKGLMDTEHSGQPLPRDMRWKADDPRWDDLTLETSWDKFVRAAAEHFKGRSVIFEIENEPQFDKWDDYQVEYAKFTIRTAKLIRATDPQAKIMVDNVYGIPSGLNAVFFREGGLKFIDVVSWHDYHAGWLTDAQGIRRMRQNMDEAGGEHVEIWFNEGWAYTNTAVDEPIACTDLTAAESTNAQACSVAEMTVAGQEKTILFHTGYEDHGQSFWDYSGPGTLLWDWYGYPLPLVAMWNVYNHHIGISEEIGLVRPPGANFAIFQDERNGKGVMIAYADRESKSDVTVELPDFGAPLVAEDIMGNAAPAPRTLVLSRTGRPVILHTGEKTPGGTFLSKLEPLDRRHAGFVSGGGARFLLPPVWEGSKARESAGNPALAEGKPVWRLDQVFPPNPASQANYHPLVWDKGWWVCASDDAGGQPKAEMKDGGIRLEFRAHCGEPGAERVCALVFIAPQAGRYELTGTIEHHMWEGATNPVRLTLLRRSGGQTEDLGAIDVARGESPLAAPAADLQAGDELIILPRIGGGHSGGDITFKDFAIARGESGGAAYRLPLSWEGAAKGGSRNNPLTSGGTPVWRLDQVWPDDPVMVANYRPLRWNGTHWFPAAHDAGGQPAIAIESGRIQFSVRGSWTGNEGQRIAALSFLTPESGTYQITGRASSKPWEGGAEQYRLGIFKKDTQRSAQQAVVLMPRSGEAVEIDLKVDLTAGHELVFLPLMPDWHNATTTTISDLVIKALPDTP